MLKAYKYRLYPTLNQIEKLNQHIGCVRLVYNMALAYKIDKYKNDNISLSAYEIKKEIVTWKKEKEFLKDVNSLSLQQAVLNCDKAFKNFFKGKGKVKFGFPKFKSKHNPRQSFQVIQNTKVEFDKPNSNNGYISIPKIKGIKAKLHRSFNGVIKSSTISKTSSGKYYISILVDTNDKLPESYPIDENQAIGLDVGIKSFIVSSDGNTIDNPKLLKLSLRKLKHLQRKLCKKKKGSNNRTKAKLKLARQHEKVRNQRSDFLHKLSNYYIKSKYTVFCLENLKIKNMVKNHKLARSINDASWYKFKTYLTYKANWNGKHIINIDTYSPSSKQCSNCNYIHKDLSLKDRIFVCPNCNHTIDRDYQASINIKHFAFAKQKQT